MSIQELGRQRLDIATKLLSAMVIEDRIAWYKDAECFGNSDSDLADRALSLADVLIKKEMQSREEADRWIHS